MDVVLTWPEVMTASLVGVMRHVKSLQCNHSNAAGFDGIGWNEHIEGACGEAALAKSLGLYWACHVNHFKGDDLPGLQVRTRRRHDWDLIVRPNDDDDARWILVTGQCPAYRVHGWIFGRDAKRHEWLRNHAGRPPAYFVPAYELNAISELEYANGR
jgi:hypothetical protein